MHNRCLWLAWFQISSFLQLLVLTASLPSSPRPELEPNIVTDRSFYLSSVMTAELLSEAPRCASYTHPRAPPRLALFALS